MFGAAQPRPGEPVQSRIGLGEEKGISPIITASTSNNWAYPRFFPYDGPRSALLWAAKNDIITPAIPKRVPRDTGLGRIGGNGMKWHDKPIRYEVHALRRMNQRGISREQVAEVVRKPQANRPAKRVGARRLESRFSARRRLAVIVENQSDHIGIISAFWM